MNRNYNIKIKLKVEYTFMNMAEYDEEVNIKSHFGITTVFKIIGL